MNNRIISILAIPCFAFISIFNVGCATNPSSYNSPYSLTYDKSQKNKNLSSNRIQSCHILVKKGDTLYSIAFDNNVELKKMAQYNNLKEPYDIKVGQILKVPDCGNSTTNTNSNAGSNNKVVVNKTSPSLVVNNTVASEIKYVQKDKYHIVKKDETLYRIAVNNNISVNRLKKLNNLKNNNIEIGDKLYIGKVNVAVSANADNKATSVATTSTSTNNKSSYLSSATNPSSSASNVSTSKPSPNVNSSVQVGANNALIQGANGNNVEDVYVVKKGDTLFSIYRKTKVKVDDLKKCNNLKSNEIEIGDKIKLCKKNNNVVVASSSGTSSTIIGNAPSMKTSDGTTIVTTTTPAVTTPSVSTNTKVTTNNTSTTVATSSKSATTISNNKTTSSNTNNVNNKSTITNSTQSVASTNSTNYIGKISWNWPTKSRKIISQFSLGDNANKGIDISDKRGSNVVSAAKGKVVYAGNALRGYGNLIIINHNDEYLSAYAHNQKILVSEGTEVKAGEIIAQMGDSEASSVRLHFEIRYKGESVNPLKYLPKK